MLNSKTKRDAYALPRINEMFDSLYGARWFSSLDIKSAYWQVEVEEADKEKTAFTVGPLGFYECNRMPIGLSNAPTTFQRLMENCLGDMNMQILFNLSWLYCCIFPYVWGAHWETGKGFWEACGSRIEVISCKVQPVSERAEIPRPYCLPWRHRHWSQESWVCEGNASSPELKAAPEFLGIRRLLQEVYKRLLQDQ